MSKIEAELGQGSSEEGFDPELLKAAIRNNSTVLGLVFGLATALAIFAATHISLAYWGEDAGGYLGLLGIFLPGYEVTAGGAWIGALWGFVFAAIAGALTYRLYGGILGERLAQGVAAQPGTADPILNPSILRIHGISLGLSVGAAMGAALFLSTSWLVIRGTADSSVHAALLSNYLPGYTVSILGGLLGGLELLALVLVACILLAAIYNALVSRRFG